MTEAANLAQKATQHTLKGDMIAIVEPIAKDKVCL
jgi:hypothetical protein